VLPVKVPDGFAFAGVGAAVVAAGAGVVAVVVEEDDEVAFLVVVAVGAGVLVAWVAAGAGVVVVVVVEVVELPPSNFPPVDDVVPNCGGVIDRTAPRPPMVPPAISNTLFAPISYLLYTA